MSTRADLEVVTGPLMSPAHLAIHVTREQPCGLCGGRAPDDCWWCEGTGKGGWVPYRWALLLNRKLVALATRRIRRLMVIAPVRHGKQVRADEPILTTTGWKTAGAIRRGDQVFGPDGQPTTVVGVSPVDFDAPKMRVRFSDATAIDVHPDHEWTVWVRHTTTRRTTDGPRRQRTPTRQWPAPCVVCSAPAARHERYPHLARPYCSEECRQGLNRSYRRSVCEGGATGWRTYETRDLAAKPLVQGDDNPRFGYQLPIRAPLMMPEADLPIDPYLLGLWLGDGMTSKGAICMAAGEVDELLGFLVADGAVVSGHSVHATTGVHYVYFDGFARTLKAAGLLGRKHIPTSYLLASIDQRRRLLQGIVDSDGHVGPEGRVRVVGHDRSLIEDVKILARSLGHRATITSQVDTREPHLVNGYLTRTAGTRYVASWTPHDGQPQGRLARKQVARQQRPERPGIVSIEPAPAADGVCIEVDRLDGLYLVGRDLIPTHNSRLGTNYYPAWYQGMNPDHRQILTGHTDDFIRTFGRSTRDLLQEHGESVFGVKVSHASEAANRWDLAAPHQGGLIAVGVGQVPTGKGGNNIVVDDPIKDPEQANSKKFRDDLWEWWQWGIRTRFEPGAVACLIMSRWHEDDLIGRIIKLQQQGSYDDSTPGAADQWEVLNLPALAEPTEDLPDPLGRQWGEALCEERYDREALLALRDDPVDGVGPRAFEALYQGRPTTPEGDVFKTFWWKYADGLPYDVTRWVRRWDLAATEDNGGNDPDWTAGVLMGRHPDGRFFVADARRLRGSELDVQKFIRATAVEDRNRFGAVEIRMAQDPGQAGKSLARIYARQVLPDFDFHYEKETGNKLVRARPYAAQVENGNVFLLRGPWNDDFVEEHRTFRGDGSTHDDQTDAAALAHSDLLKPRTGDGGTSTNTALDGRR